MQKHHIHHKQKCRRVEIIGREGEMNVVQTGAPTLILLQLWVIRPRRRGIWSLGLASRRFTMFQHYAENGNGKSCFQTPRQRTVLPAKRLERWPSVYAREGVRLAFTINDRRSMTQPRTQVDIIAAHTSFQRTFSTTTDLPHHRWQLQRNKWIAV